MGLFLDCVLFIHLYIYSFTSAALLILLMFSMNSLLVSLVLCNFKFADSYLNSAIDFM